MKRHLERALNRYKQLRRDRPDGDVFAEIYVRGMPGSFPIQVFDFDVDDFLCTLVSDVPGTKPEPFFVDVDEIVALTICYELPF